MVGRTQYHCIAPTRRPNSCTALRAPPLGGGGRNFAWCATDPSWSLPSFPQLPTSDRVECPAVTAPNNPPWSKNRAGDHSGGCPEPSSSGSSGIHLKLPPPPPPTLPQGDARVCHLGVCTLKKPANTSTCTATGRGKESWSRARNGPGCLWPTGCVTEVSKHFKTAVPPSPPPERRVKSTDGVQNSKISGPIGTPCPPQGLLTSS